MKTWILRPDENGWFWAFNRKTKSVHPIHIVGELSDRNYPDYLFQKIDVPQLPNETEVISDEQKTTSSTDHGKAENDDASPPGV